MTVYGTLIESAQFIKHILTNGSTRIMEQIMETTEKMDPNQITALELFGRQSMWALILRCMQFLGNYWARHLPTMTTESFCKTV